MITKEFLLCTYVIGFIVSLIALFKFCELKFEIITGLLILIFLFFFPGVLIYNLF